MKQKLLVGYNEYNHLTQHCPRAFFAHQDFSECPQEVIQTIFQDKTPYNWQISPDFSVSNPNFAYQDFWSTMFARLKNWLGTADPTIKV